MNICILKLSAIGDCICTVPMVRALQRQYPNAKITWIISNPAHALLAGLSGVEFIVIKKPRGLTDYFSLYQMLKARGQVFDVLLAMQTSLRANLILPLIKAKRKIGFDSARSKEGQRWFVNEAIAAGEKHCVMQYLQFLEKVVSQDNNTMDLAPLKKSDFLIPVLIEDQTWVKQLLQSDKKYLALNPAASSREKTAQPELYAQVLQKAHDAMGYEIIITGGSGKQEIQLAEEICAALDFEVINLTGRYQLSLKRLAALYQAVDLVIAPDTGPMHLADAMGATVVSLFAVTDPRLAGPYHQLSHVVSAYPQDLPFGKRTHDQGAMAKLSVEQVMRSIHLAIAK